MHRKRWAEAPPARRFVSFLLTYGRWILIAAVLVAAPAAWRTAELYAHLESDLTALLPEDAPSVRALEELQRRMDTRSWLGIVVDAGDPAKAPGARRLLEDLAARIRAYPPDLSVRRVIEGSAEERAFFERHAPLYLSVDDLAALRDRLIARREWEVSHRMDLLLEDEPPPSLGLDELAARFGGARPRAGDRFVSADGKTSVLLVEVARMESGTALSGALFRRVRADLDAMGAPAAYGAGMRVGFAGDVAARVEEQGALASDLALASVVVLAAVSAVIIFHYRWWRAVPVLGAPLLIGAALAFAICTLPPLSIRALNANTAFLGSIIIGNGVNTGIILLARYVEERRSGAAQEPAIVTAIGATWRPTATAAAAAALAYGSLALTGFRGFNQFGWIGALGMVLCWSLTMILVPPLLARLDRGAGAAALTAGRRPPVGAVLERVAGLLGRHARLVLLLSLIPTAASVVALARVNERWIETDYGKLRRADTAISGEAYWGARMNEVLGRYLTPMVISTSDLAETRRVAAGVREASRGELAGAIARVVTADDVVPPDGREKAAILGEIARIVTPRMRDALSPEDRGRVAELLSPEALRPITADDLPDSIAAGLRDRGGRIDRAVLVFPDPSAGLWQVSTLRRIAVSLRAVAARAARPGEPAPMVAGATVLSYDILETLRHDGPEITAIAFALVLCVLCVAFRGSAAALLVAGSLVVAVIWLVGVLRLFQVKLNFSNFVAFPITFGIGADYGVNVVGRWLADGRRDVLGAVRSTGGAVVLASATTVIGYTSLLIAQNRALFLFGFAAVLGELATVTNAIAVLPSVILVLRGEDAAREPAPDARR